MVVVSKRKILFTAPDKETTFLLLRDYMGPVPEWVTKLPYFSDLVSDGKILIAEKPAEPKETKKTAKADKE